MIYFDNAATTRHIPDCVLQAVLQAMCTMGNSGRGAHASALDTARLVYETRERIAALFGLGEPSQVAFTANSTEALNMAIQGLFNPGDHVITTQMEHNSVLRPLYHMEGLGVELTILPANRQGNISLCEMEGAISKNTRAIVCTHASNLTGNMNDLAAIGKICRKHQLLFVVDASQTAGIFPINMEEMGIDVLCFTGHKSLLGPQGTGGICVRRGVTLRPLLMGGTGVLSHLKTQPQHMPELLEAGTLNNHGLAGLRAALLWLEEQGMEQLQKKELSLMWQFYDGILQIPGMEVYGDFSDRSRPRAPIVAINLKGWDSGQVADVLGTEYGISVRAGAHCAPLMHEALGTVERGAVRVSFSHTNTGEEVEAAIRALQEIAGES